MASSMKTQAYVKMLLHAAKYPHSAVNGLFLRKKSKSEGEKLTIIECIPLFHENLDLVPMLEVALNQVEMHCLEEDLSICGYYHIHGHLNDEQRTVLVQKIMEKINENIGKAYLFMVSNYKMNSIDGDVPFSVYELKDGKLVEGPKVIVEDGALELGIRHIQSDMYNQLVDFDNHLDNLCLDWRNQQLDFS